MDAIVKISRILYEPLAVTVLIAIVLAFYLNRKTRDILFIYLSAVITVMVIWRVGIQIISSRYASILIYLTIILVAYLFYRVTELFPKIPYLRRMPEKYYPWISRALLVGMLIPCVIKDFRFNRHARFISESSMAIKADAANYRYPVLLDFTGEAGRMQYYSGIESQFIRGPAAPKNMAMAVAPYRFLYDAIYVTVNESPGAGIAFENDDKWELISSKFKNNRKRVKFSVYRYTPPPGDDLWRKVEPEQWRTPEFLVPNGDFEEFIVIKPDDGRTADHRKNGLTFFFNDFKFPILWNIWGTIGFARGSKAEAENSENAICGNYSLRMKSSGDIVCFGAPANDIDDYLWVFLIRGEVNSRFAAAVYQYDAANKYVGLKILTELKVRSDGVFSYHIPISKEDFLPGATKFRIFFWLRHGEIFIDDVSLAPLEDKAK